jgi:hypothetical protein
LGFKAALRFPRVICSDFSSSPSRSCNFISEKFSQPGFETHFSRCVPIRLQPSFEILNADLVRSLGLPDNN